jgi:hypothetical protein
MTYDQDSFQREVLIMLGDIRVLCATTAANQTAQHERIEKLEASNVRQWWFTGAILPVIGILHAIAKKLGV